MLRGTVWRLGGRLRLTAQLLDARSGTVLRAAKLDGVDTDLFEMQDRIVAQVVAAIAPTVRSQELQRAMRKPPESVTAYDSLIEALSLMPRLDQPLYVRAGELLERVIALDPGYAPARAYRALWHLIRIAQGWTDDTAADIAAATDNARAALERDPNNAWALAIQGHLLSYTRRDYDAAALVLDRAVASGPNNPLAWAFLSATSSYLGRGAAAILAAEHAIRLSPVDPFGYLSEHFMARAQYVAGDYAEAVRWGRRVQVSNPRHAANLRQLAVSLVANGELAAARAVGAGFMANDPGFSVAAFAARTPLNGAQLQDYVAKLYAAGLTD